MATQRICSISDCGKPARAKKLCERHYRRIKAHGQPDLPPRISRRVKCSVDGCEVLARGHGLCQHHYDKRRRANRPISRNRNGAGLAFIAAAMLQETDECIIWPYGRSTNGYGGTHVDGKYIAAHRYVCILAHGEPPSPDHEAAHSCGKGRSGCINKNHLRWDTAKGNAADRKIHGTHRGGERIPWSKLTDADVLKIRAASGSSLASLARQYNVSSTTISDIRMGETWKHLL